MTALLSSWFTRHECARIYPFAGFILLLAAEPWLAAALTWLGLGAEPTYLLRSVCALWLLLYFRRDYLELRVTPTFNQALAALLAGWLVFLLWIAPYPVWLGGHGASPVVAMPTQTHADIFWLICRWSGSALVVPVIEELFWRSYVMRRLDSADFMAVAPATVTAYAIAVSSVLFAVEHQLWLAGLLAGLVYAWLYRHFQVLWVSILAHVTTNAVLGLWVMYTGHWQYW
ncbi:CAAX prenyl protease-related protein [Methylophilus sp. QUAN]|uniref:CAAX prenyl protease-related protein n=1 Tax=Methylophilus sp. QUAN TaxID=2781020 RepID=UPI00188F030C|nr:CAAX prenyl protease-related protein [Methylophilus sp. QUAN]MBF4991215.1 CAAX prenyl protease-related protein [Methylophilus sp. QUAN]